MILILYGVIIKKNNIFKRLFLYSCYNIPKDGSMTVYETKFTMSQFKLQLIGIS